VNRLRKKRSATVSQTEKATTERKFKRGGKTHTQRLRKKAAANSSSDTAAPAPATGVPDAQPASGVPQPQEAALPVAGAASQVPEEVPELTPTMVVTDQPAQIQSPAASTTSARRTAYSVIVDLAPHLRRITEIAEEAEAAPDAPEAQHERTLAEIRRSIKHVYERLCKLEQS
jgi:hypothetical protein